MTGVHVVYVKASERREQLIAAARAVLARGVAGTTLRAVAAEAGVPLGTLHYIFPSKELMLAAVIDDVRQEVSAVFLAAESDAGLEHAIRSGLNRYWDQLIVNDPDMALMRHELQLHALRTPGLEHLARAQMDGYVQIVAKRCQEAADTSGETCAVDFDTIARVLVGSTTGMVLQYLTDHDRARSQRDLDTIAEMLIHLAGVEPGPT